MPQPEHSHRFQPAVLWPYTGVDSNGDVTVGSPEALIVRWDDSQKEVVDKDGQTVTVDCQCVYKRASDIEIGSLMCNMSLTDLTGTSPTSDDSPLMITITQDTSLDIRGRVICQEISLMRYRKKIPGDERASD